jgi:hypothetical protein
VRFLDDNDIFTLLSVARFARRAVLQLPLELMDWCQHALKYRHGTPGTYGTYGTWRDAFPRAHSVHLVTENRLPVSFFAGMRRVTLKCPALVRRNHLLRPLLLDLSSVEELDLHSEDLLAVVEHCARDVEGLQVWKGLTFVGAPKHLRTLTIRNFCDDFDRLVEALVVLAQHHLRSLYIRPCVTAAQLQCLGRIRGLTCLAVRVDNSVQAEHLTALIPMKLTELHVIPSTWGYQAVGW